MPDKHALFATCRARNGAILTFRLGQPVDWHTAMSRWHRLDNRRSGLEGQVKRDCFVLWYRRRYRVEFFEVRAVDYNGRGLGSDRHATAFPVPFRTCTTRRR